VVVGCGEKMPLPTNIPDNPDGRLVDTVYLPLRPIWTEADGIPFSRPSGIAVGYDRTLYISDTDNDRIVRCGVDGTFIESFDIAHPVAVAQDRGFNLVCVTRSHVIWLRRFLDHGDFEPFLETDSILQCKTTPSGDTVCGWVKSSFLDVAASPQIDGWFYVIDEGFNLVRRFSVEFPFLQRGADSGSAPGEVVVPLRIATGLSREGYRVYITQYGMTLGLQYLDGRRRDPVGLDESADVFHQVPFGYKLVAADDLGNVYLLTYATSEVIKFDRFGRKLLAFGREGDDLFSLNNPRGIAVLDETVYIADTDNNRIVRYRLATVPEG
jgi:hypothetical protein